jgi:uncharacterized protein
MNPKTQHDMWVLSCGQAEVSIDYPNNTPLGLAVVAHPHPLFGGTKDNKVVQTIARSFLQLGYITVRFNFRGVGNSDGNHDHGRGEAQDLIEVVQKAHANLLDASLQSAPIALGGFSFGAFVTTHAYKALSEQGYKLGKMALVGTAASRFEVAQVPENTLVIHGEIDDTVPLQSVLDWARPQNLPVLIMPGVEHFFHGQLPLLKNTLTRYYPC